MEKHLIEFQQYEIEIILQGLAFSLEKSGRKWERQPSGDFYYTDNKRSKQIKFIEKSIKRQLENKKVVE